MNAAPSAEMLRAWHQEALSQDIPAASVYLKCVNWGLSRLRAADLAEEATAEALLRSLRQQFESKSHFRHWLIRAATNFAVDTIRHETCRRRPFPEDAIALAVGIDDWSEVLREAMSCLDEKERDVIRLIYGEEMTLDQTASILFPLESTSRNATRLRVKRIRDAALSQMRDFLSRQGIQSVAD